MGQKLGRPPFWEGELGTHLAQLAEAYLHAKCHLDPSSHLATTGAKKMGAVPPFLGRELGPHLAQCGLAKAHLHTKWHLDPFSHLATTDMGRKLGAVPLSERGRWVPI